MNWSRRTNGQRDRAIPQYNPKHGAPSTHEGGREGGRDICRASQVPIFRPPNLLRFEFGKHVTKMSIPLRPNTYSLISISALITLTGTY